MRVGATLQGVYPPGEFVQLVRWIEELGYDDLWITDSSLHAGDCYVYSTLALTATERLRVGTAVTNPLTRHPGITANAFRSLVHVAPGRVACGIGVGDRPLSELGLPMARLATLRETVAAIRALWAGETLDRDVGRWRFADGRLLSPIEAPPVLVSASQPRTLELSGEIADGVILLIGLFPEGVTFAREHLAAGRARSERLEFQETFFLYGAIDEDEAAALESARSIAAWFPKTAPVYARLAGMTDELIGSVNTAYTGGEFQKARHAASLISDDLVRKIAFCGTTAQAREKLDWIESEGPQAISVFPIGADRRGTIERFAQIAVRKRVRRMTI
jgi:5,10-methylenetetrahydromethanopterin reductase